MFLARKFNFSFCSFRFAQEISRKIRFFGCSTKFRFFSFHAYREKKSETGLRWAELYFPSQKITKHTYICHVHLRQNCTFVEYWDQNQKKMSLWTIWAIWANIVIPLCTCPKKSKTGQIQSCPKPKVTQNPKLSKLKVVQTQSW